MKVSIIVAVYKDVKSLQLIVKALENQIYKNFEVIIAEDGSCIEMREYIQTIKTLDVKHTIQEDIGLRKARSQNNGLLAANGEYIIFIDGDCIPHKNFVNGHVLLSEKGCVLSGRRMNIPIKLVKKIKEGSLYISDIENNLWKYSYLTFSKNIKFRQAIYLNPNKLLYKIISKRNASTSILGCNFSCFKKDMIELNGFDESYIGTAISDDTDLEWRFQAHGIKLKSCKNIANMFHLEHKVSNRSDASAYLKIMHQRKCTGECICKDGLNTHAL